MREVIVVGAGIAGLNAALAISGRGGGNHVTLVDAHTYHTLPPQLARGSAGLAAFSQMALMLPQARRDLTILRAAVESVDASRRAVLTDTGELTGDRIIIAVGRGPARGLQRSTGSIHAPYDAQAAAKLRLVWEAALAAAGQHRTRRQAPVRLAIIGGGAFGIELALSFASMRPVLCQRHSLSASLAEIHLFEAADRLLPGWPRRAADLAGRELYLSDVEVRVHCPIAARTATGLISAAGDEFPADIVVWAAGREINRLLVNSGLPLGAQGVLVDRAMRVEGYGDIYAIGDCVDKASGWDWARLSAKVAVDNALSRSRKRPSRLPPGRRAIDLFRGGTLVRRGNRLSRNPLLWSPTLRLLGERLRVGGWPMVVQAWPSPTPDHSLAAWRDAAERRRLRHAERRQGHDSRNVTEDTPAADDKST